MKIKNITSLLVVMLAMFSLTTMADEAFRNHRYSSFKALPACQEGDVVFIGNSITNMMNWYEAFGSQQNIHGRGNSGGYTREILDNLESMIAGNPSKVFLMIGTNDLGTAGDQYAPAPTAERIQKILARVRAEAPGATVYYQSILPSLSGIRTKAKTEETNKLVKEWIEARKDEKVVYVDLYSLLAAADGSLSNTADQNASSYSYDGLHLTQKGYRIWMNAIKDYVGAECVYPETADNLHGNLNGSNGMRVSYFGASPVKASDILLIGDEMIHNGEWHELLGSADFKDRGIGWGYPSVKVAQVAGTFDAILTGNTDKGVTKEAPRAVCLYAGLSDVQAGSSASTIFAAYQNAVNSLRQKLPNTPIFVMTVLPFASGSATQASTIVTLNESIRTLANEATKIYVIDTYAATYGDARDEACFMGTGNIYLTGLGYARVAQEIAKTVNEKLGTTYKALTDEEAQKNMGRFSIRTAAYGKSYTAGTTLGTYDAEAVAAYNKVVEEAIAALDSDDADLEALGAKIDEAAAAVKVALVQPSAQNAGEEHEFQLFTPNRGSKYMTSNGAGKGVTGTSKTNYNEQRWKFLPREDGTWNIRNVADESYLSPVATWNSQITTSADVPEAGWEFSYCNNDGLYIIQSGNVQLNQTNDAALYNWSASQSGNDRSDLGCQFQIVDVTDIEADVREPIVIPTGSFEEKVCLENGLLYRSGTPYDAPGSWCSIWKSEDGLLTFDSGVNNMQWNGSNIDARSGSAGASTYTLSCNEDYVITGYTMTLTALSTYPQTWTFEDQTVVTSSTTDPKVVTYENLNTGTISMSLTGSNNPGGTLITDFVVTLKSKNVAIKVDLLNGDLAFGAGSTFAGTWASSSTDPQVELYCQINPNTGVRTNNMNANGDEVNLYRGASDCTYYIGSLTEGYEVIGYEFDFIGLTNPMTITPAEGGPAATCSTTEAAHVEASGFSAETTSFVLSGAGNYGVKLSNAYIYLKAVDKSLVANDRFVVFKNPSTEGVPYRIPAIAKAQNGDLIAVADYRYSGSDIGMAVNGKLDLRFRIKDHATGEWGDVKTLIAARGEGNANIAFGDPCIVADRTSNRVLVTSCCGNVSFPGGTHENHQGWAHMYSEDGGKTWSEYTDRSQQVFDQLDLRSDGQIRCFFIGSGKITQSTTIKKGDYYRLYCAALVKTGNNVNTNYVFYSDDFGENWLLLGTPDDCPVPGDADEPKAEELPDGSVLVSSRISGGRFYNIFHFTDALNGKGAWEKVATSNASVGGVTASSNACNGETFCLPVERVADGKKMFIFLQSVPFGPSGRTNVGINYKELADLSDFRMPTDIAKDWDGKLEVTKLTSGYSTMTLDADNDIAFFYEENQQGNGYDMVYKKYSIEDITDGQYAYAAMTPADSTAYMSEAVSAYLDSMEGQFGDIVGQYTEEAKAVIEAAQEAYTSNPGRDSYAEFNAALASAPYVEVEEGKTYNIINYGRSSQTATYVMSVGDSYFVGANEANADLGEGTQQFRFVSTGVKGEYYLYNPETGRYFGKLGANETQVAHVETTAQAGTFRIESNSYGRSALNNIDHTSSNAYIHLAGDCTRLVPWSASEPSLWYIVPISQPDAIEGVVAEPTTDSYEVYDLFGRKVNEPKAGGVYIINRKKVLVK